MAKSYTYTGLGDRVSEMVNGVTTSFTLDLNVGLMQGLADGTNTYLYGTYFLGDALGSMRQLVDGSGVVTLVQSYEPYGERLSSVGSGASIYGFDGEQFEGLCAALYPTITSHSEQYEKCETTRS